MKYENPIIREGINTSAQHPLKTFLTLLIGLLVVLVLSAWLLGIGGGYLASQIPYSQEKRLADLYAEEITKSDLLDYLQALANRVGEAMELDPEVDITVHYVDEGVENAFATIGGNIFFYKGLLQRMPNENTLAMLVAHEIGHVKYRDPIVSVGQGAAITTGMMLLLGRTDTGFLGSAGLLTQMKFSRGMETRSDEVGLKAVEQLYGHSNGALELYRILGAISDNSVIEPPPFLSTHPMSEARLNALRALIAQKGWQQDGSLTPLPKEFSLWLSES